MKEPPTSTDRASGYAMRGLQARVIDGVGRAVVGGRFAPGDLVPKESALTEEYGVSRTSVREGMRVLAAKGLVDIRQKVGTRVRRPEQWNVFDADILRWHSEEGLGEVILRDLVEVRQILEPAAAHNAAGRATMEDLHRLGDALRAMEAAAAVDDDAYAHADVEFHLAVYAASHNVLLRQFGTVVADFLHLSFSIQQGATRGRSDLLEDARRHQTVLEAIDRGKSEAAAEAMLDVVMDGKRALIAAFGDRRTPRA